MENTPPTMAIPTRKHPLPVSAVVPTLDQANQSLELSFRSLFESAPDAMLLTDDQGKILLLNARTEQMFGYSREELIGERVETLIPERFRANHTDHRSAYSATPGIRPMGNGYVLCGLKKDGSEFPVEISLSPMKTDRGMLVSSAIRDVSERKRIEELHTSVGL